MAKTPRPKNPDEDEAQSKRFFDLAAELEAAGDLSPTDGERALDRLLEKGAPPKRRKPP
jgi:hypothetical protein